MIIMLIIAIFVILIEACALITLHSRIKLLRQMTHMCERKFTQMDREAMFITEKYRDSLMMLSKAVFRCDKCGKFIAKGKSVWIDDDVICQECKAKRDKVVANAKQV